MEMVAQALAGIDDTTVLVDERPVAVDSLWRHIIASSIEEPVEALTLLHPSWWSRGRVTRLADAAACVTADVVTVPRAEVIRRQSDGVATVVELSADIVAVCSDPGASTLFDRSVGADAVAAAIDPSAAILIDAPHGIVGADGFVRGLRTALHHRGMAATVVRVEDLMAHQPAPAPATRVRHSWLPAQVAAAAAVTIVMSAVGVVTTRGHHEGRTLDPTATTVTEGRVAMRIPASWTVTRITEGPGSRRVEITSPTDSATALQLTQSYAPEQTLQSTADVLRAAVGRAAPGVFVDFNPADRRGGRDAVTYREIRPGRAIRWSVLLDGSTRICIGCQSAPGRESDIAPACEQAIRSAREFGGTRAPR